MTNTARYQNQIEELKKEESYRILQNGVPLHTCNLSSNDYLGIQKNEELYDEFLDELHFKNYGFSAASSRLLSGNHQQYNELETILSNAYNGKSALVYNSGYHANCGILPAITNRNDLIIADKYIHASIIDGLRMSTAKFERFKHNDYEHLEKILAEHAHKYEHIFIVTESIFSMDGDCADLPKLVTLKKKYNAFLYVDEAHAIGIRGERGLGLSEEYNCIQDCDFIVGTFGKAISSVGAFVICNEVFKTYLINHSRTLIYTTALPPINVAWTSFIMKQLPSFTSKREKLHALSKEFSEALKISAESHIIPFVIGDNAKTIACAEALQAKGFFVLPIRFPTVPKNTARLRFSLHAGISFKSIQPIVTYLSQFA